MRLSLVLALVAALTASVYASDAEAEGCPFICKHDDDCTACQTPKCVSSLHPGYNHTNNRRCIRTAKQKRL
ncbi:hypothetical protein C8R48DRAFT_693527 [Suillus tomentosus]|nr:hypothetical protein C8R48DRAFT_693527 [Suillus tomentosus]